MTTQKFDSRKISLALKNGNQVRITFSLGTSAENRLATLGFQADPDSTVRQVYRKSNQDSDFLNLTITRPTIDTLVQLLEDETMIRVVRMYQVLPKDWCSVSGEISDEKEKIVDENPKPFLEQREGILVKEGWVWDRKSGTVIGVALDGSPRELRPDHLTRLAPEKFYHVSVLGRGIRDPLGKIEFQETLSRLKSKGRNAPGKTRITI